MDQTTLRDIEELPLSGSQLCGVLDEVLSRGSSVRFRAGGVSMVPFIRDGDVITITPLVGRAPAVGEVVAFRRSTPQGAENERLIVHRVVRNTGNGCIILGDNQPPHQPDGPIAREQLLGVVSRIERQEKTVRFGLGPERVVIAILSRSGLLRPSVRIASILYRPFRMHLP